MDRRGWMSDDDQDDRDDDLDEQKVSESLGSDERRRQQLQLAAGRSRKRQKRESLLAASQLSAVRQEVAEIRRALDAVARASPESADASERAHETLELSERVAFLRDKLEAHLKWMVSLRNLLASAPLLDYALRMHEDHDTDDQEAKESHHGDDDDDRSVAMVDAWRQDDTSSVFSSLLVANHVHAAVAMSQANVDKLLTEFSDPECDFSVQFSSRGWSHAAHVDDKLLTFRCSRVVPCTTARAIALAVWRSLQCDDILRTFVTVLQDVVPVYDAETAKRIAMERVVKFETGGPPDAIVTIESMQEFATDGNSGWQIAAENCDDPLLIAYAADYIAAASAQLPPTPNSPAVQPGGCNFVKRPDFVVAARCFETVGVGGGGGVMLQFAGSVRHDGTWLVNSSSAVELVQYLVCMMPLYEELHLLSKNHGDAG
jgi:hypothetical protein